MRQLGDRWQAAAERYAQRKAQQQAFDTEIAARRLNGELAQAEADAVAHSPADGAGHRGKTGPGDETCRLWRLRQRFVSRNLVALEDCIWQWTF
ncbi:hypothetical protein [Mesorhizobium sp. M2C.T.Ca.TU.002.02.1.1]|uniref:hypothetical protein n=1 Tax=Mesorhizobium sp. M2C.T.Ca.TU.002.02.1.1 TaxID=2496788 RepID=UPI000FCB478B|nr:hypothetical protein [Mesorhizobium sp. M2C.T.Ca.TU.002.02.1.1]RUU57105.1 hypothetical protein EOD07_13935 [Mesorhizobium sp. M2C.T.Ca.TU.002.02.1.1]RUU61513.1 hypothetical protein EOD04_26200 [Mesorhizobium sp. M2C.T.Ca.TU.009.01.2.1]